MADLFYKTRKHTLKRGMAKVYFCCDARDFDAFFEEISNEILARQNCSIWYHGSEPVVYDEEFYARLEEMQLFVVPITSRFLQEGNLALEKEFHFALEKGIPVLPLMQERGLSKRFTQLCGSLQYLDKYNTDSTCIEYSDKLDKFLSSVLVGDELAEKIRNAFDAYVFLSYRKKDRRYAQTLMRLIHQNEFCRDIAIWYDEFLVPGEDFNEAISDALQKSDLFVLTVTPNLVNEHNYIMRVEFPMAQKHQKPILPCEMVETDKNMLAELYDSIPECADGRDGVMLSERLRQHFLDIAIRENDNDPEHLFFIGLAYLNGIDVEVDRLRALELITAAAEYGLPEAIEKLITMYATGEGVKFNMQEVLKWRKKLVEIYGRLYAEDKEYTNAFQYMLAYFELATLYEQQNHYEDALAACDTISEHYSRLLKADEYEDEEFFPFRRVMALTEMLRGKVYHSLGKLDDAATKHCVAMYMLSTLSEEWDEPYVLRDLALLYTQAAKLSVVRADYEKAIQYYEEALKIQESIQSEYEEELHRLDQVLTRMDLCEAMRLTGRMREAKRCCLVALDILDGLTAIYGAGRCAGVRMLLLLNLAGTYHQLGNLEKVLEIYDEYAILEKVFEEYTGTDPAMFRAKRLLKVTQAYYCMANMEAVIEYGEQALELINDDTVITESEQAFGFSGRISLPLFLGVAYYTGRGDVRRAMHYLDRAMVEGEMTLKRGTMCNVSDVILAYSSYAEILQAQDEERKACDYLEKAVVLYEKHLAADENYRNLCSAFPLYLALGKNRNLLGMNPEAIVAFKKAHDIYNKITVCAPDAEELIRRDYINLCFFMGSCYADMEDAHAEEWYCKCLDTYAFFPEDTYTFAEWHIKGLTLYQLWCMSSGFLKTRRLEKQLIKHVETMEELYPEEFPNTMLYQLLTGEE